MLKGERVASLKTHMGRGHLNLQECAGPTGQAPHSERQHQLLQHLPLAAQLHQYAARNPSNPLI